MEPRRIELLTSSLPEWRSDCSVSKGEGGKMKRIAENFEFAWWVGQAGRLLSLAKLGGVLLSLAPVTGW